MILGLKKLFTMGKAFALQAVNLGSRPSTHMNLKLCQEWTQSQEQVLNTSEYVGMEYKTPGDQLGNQDTYQHDKSHWYHGSLRGSKKREQKVLYFCALLPNTQFSNLSIRKTSGKYPLKNNCPALPQCCPDPLKQANIWETVTKKVKSKNTWELNIM